MKLKSLLFTIGLIAFSTTVWCKIYYVAPTGVNTNAGTISAPFLTIQRAQDAVVAGDTVYIRGGNYVMTESLIATYNSIWAYVTYLTKSGTSGKRINYWAYPGETPVFDYTAIKPAGYRITAFQVNASWVHIKGIEVVGVQVTILTHTQSECFENQGSNNIYEMLKMHDGKAIGFYLTKGGNNLILNCDAYNNWDDVSETKKGGNVDGFGCHPNNDGVGYTNNVFRGCRAWFNSDDGYDCINAFEATTFENCWAFYNGYSTTFASLGDGNGFKVGGYGVSTTPSVPTVIPRNTTRFCLAVRNKANGFYANHHLGGSDWYNNSAYTNAVNYNMLNRSADYLSDVSGYGHNLKNNLGLSPRSSEYSSLDFTLCNADSNAFNLPVTVSSADFLSIDQALLTAPRQADGSLPSNNFMKLASGSDLIDKGLNIGFSYNGAAPDLGCFESNYTALPVHLLSFTAATSNNNVLLNWQVQNQVQNKGWQIERATNITTPNWQTIGFVAGANVTAITNYNFTDANIATGKYYYRLKQIDVDGSIAYSTVQQVIVGSVSNIDVSVYPVPATNGSTVSYYLPEATNVQLQLYNASGKLVNTLVNTTQTAGTHTVSLGNTLSVNAGVYLLVLHANNTTVNKLFIKK